MDTFLQLLGQRLWATSLQTVALAALVWLLCRFVRRLPPAAQCGLWWLVALQAVVGLLWAVPLEVPVLPAAHTATVVRLAPVVVQAAAEAAPAPLPMAALPPPNDSGSWLAMAMAAWLAGVSLMALRTVAAWRASRALLHAAQPCADKRLQAALQLAAEAHGLRRAPRLLLSAAIDSPQLIGPWRPALLLPARGAPRMDDDDLDMALTHELVHLQRRDLWWGLLPALAQHLFFFHPLIHWAAREYAIARETAVDAAVVAGNRHSRQHYARLLLQLGVASRPGAGLASASPTFLSLKRRLLMLQNTSTFSRLGAGLIVAAVAVLGVLPLRLVAMPASAPTPLPPSPPVLPASPVAVASPAASALPVPAVPTTAPVVEPIVNGTLRSHGAAGAQAYVLLKDGFNIMDGTMEDLRQAQRLDDGNGLLWLRRDGKQYVVRDSATLAWMKDLFAASARLGAEQGKLGEQQGRLGAQQGELGSRMAAANTRIADLANAQARAELLRADLQHARELRLSTEQAQQIVEQAREELRRSGLEDAHARLAVAESARQAEQQAREELNQSGLQEQLQELARQQAQLGAQQSRLGQQQAALARQQAEANAKAERDAERAIQQAIRDGRAKPVD